MKSFLLSLTLALGFVFAQPAHAVVSSATKVRWLYSTNNVVTTGYSTLFASFSKAIKGFSIYNSGINPVVLAVGGAGAEVDQIVIPAGGTAAVGAAVGPASVFYPMAVSQGQRLSVKSLDSILSVGELDINAFYY